MTNYSFTTARGTLVNITIVTERICDADHTVTVPCHDLHIQAGSQLFANGGDVIDHPQHGVCIKLYSGDNLIPVPAAHVDGVRAIIAGYKDEIKRRAAFAANLRPTTLPKGRGVADYQDGKWVR